MENSNIENDLYVPVSKEERVQNEFVRPSVSYWQDAWGRLKKIKWLWRG